MYVPVRIPCSDIGGACDSDVSIRVQYLVDRFSCRIMTLVLGFAINMSMTMSCYWQYVAGALYH